MTFKHLIFLLGLLAPAHASPVLLEAEANPQGTVKPDATCTGGAYVAAPNKDYLPVFIAPLPPGLSTNVVIYVRRSGAPVQLKGVAGTVQTELAWDWRKTSEFTWCKMGPFERSKLGESILLIRGTAGPAVAVDSVVITDESSLDLEALLPSLPPVPLEVDWDAPGKRVTRDHFGLNASNLLNPEVASQQDQLERLKSMNPGILRIDNPAMLDDSASNPSAWVDYPNKCWQKERILRALAPLRNLPTRLILCISAWPSWMDQDRDGRLDIGQHDAYAKFCADLVEIVNAPGAGEPIIWWEITREMDVRYHAPFHDAKQSDLLDELTHIYINSATAMRAADPRIKTGGPATRNSFNMDFQKRFIVATAPLLDFYSTHCEAVSNRDSPTEEILQKCEAAAWPLASVHDMLHEISPNRNIELIVGEFNIDWGAKPNDGPTHDRLSAVWNIGFCLASINAGADKTTIWNESDGAFLKNSADLAGRSPGAALGLINRLLPASKVSARIKAPAEAALKVLALCRDNGSRALIIMNLGPRARTVTGIRGQAFLITHLETTNAFMDHEITLPAMSVAIIECE